MEKIKLMAEYRCFPLWDTSELIPKNIQIETLPISDNLKLDISLWGKSYEETLDEEYPPNSGFKSIEELNIFELKAQEILNRLKKELGPEVVIEYEKTSNIKE